jgi:hypothetical protein
MKIYASLLATIVVALLQAGATHALTVDQIIKLKQAGVSDATIELLILRDTPSIGVWKEDGWIVYSTERRLPSVPEIIAYPDEYPITVYPQIYDERRGRRHRPK